MGGLPRRRGPRRGLINLTFSANLVEKDAWCSAGSASRPAAASAASTAAREAPHARSAHARLRDDDTMRRLVVSGIPNSSLTREFDMPEAHAARTATANASEYARYGTTPSGTTAWVAPQLAHLTLLTLRDTHPPGTTSVREYEPWPVKLPGQPHLGQGTPPRLPPGPVLRSMEAAFRALGALEPRGPAGQSLTRPAPAAPPLLILIAKE